MGWTSRGRSGESVDDVISLTLSGGLLSDALVCSCRHQKCRTCCRQLKNLSNVVKNRAVQVGRHGSAFRELQLLMLPLEDIL